MNLCCQLLLSAVILCYAFSESLRVFNAYILSVIQYILMPVKYSVSYKCETIEI